MNIEEQVVNLLKDRKMLITTAESCTGGMIASSIVNVSGASNVFHQGYITYCDEAKVKMLGVSSEIIDKYKAVSPQVACEMASKAMLIADADIAVSVTGVAGPSMEDGKPVGLVYIGLALRKPSDYIPGLSDDIRTTDITELESIMNNTGSSEVLYSSSQYYVLVRKNMFDGDRSGVRNKACNEALCMVAECLKI